MPYDLVIKNGTVIDGSGLPRYRADVAVRHGRVAAIGRIREAAREVIDADGQMVTPGFIDGHTHMDAQIFWDPYGTCSCWHGVTTVVMGNCGFTLAPCGKSERHLVVRNLERAEDIARHRLDLDDVPGVPGPGRNASQGHQLRRLRGSLGAAHVRHGRTCLREGSQ